uniref:Uncharacterized protein n=1 Tax=Eubacterium cellulosolvens (strain ATCC 43171 / JCM 9499 / 6) TaxID=633697 RepID=I5AQG8_EUBC6
MRQPHFVDRYRFLGDDIKIICFCFCLLRLLHMSLQNKYGCGLNTNKIYDIIDVFNRYIGYCVYVVTETDSAFCRSEKDNRKPRCS